MSASTTQMVHLGRLPAQVTREMQRLDMPAMYLAAKNAVLACEGIDELREWENRMAAMAAYATQAGDNSIRDAAVRIQLRARARLGELLAEFRDPKERRGVAEKAGIRIGHVRVNMLLARVPVKVRENLIERSPPANVPEFRAHDPIYIAQKNRRGPDEREVAADQVYVLVSKLETMILCFENKGLSAADVAHTVRADCAGDVTEERRLTLRIIEWLDAYACALPKVVERK